jgi:hypothetical protein
MLQEVIISGRRDTETSVVIEPYCQEFSIPPNGLMEISIDDVERTVEINLNEDGGITVWLFEAGEITVWDRATLDAGGARARRRLSEQPKTLDDVTKELRRYARRAAAEEYPPDEREGALSRVKSLELTRDMLLRGEILPPDLRAELLAWALAEERLPKSEVFVGYLRAAVELGSTPSKREGS